MAENSKISWTDNTFNPWIGCTKVSPGCANCYAERDWDRRRHVAQWGPVGTRIVTSEENWRKPLRWNKQAEESGTRIKVFCASLADVFEETMTDVRSRLFQLIDSTPHLDWLLVTKRPENIRTMWPNRPCGVAKVCSRGDGIICANDSCDLETGVMTGTHRPNVWLLASVENQEQADKRIPELLKCRDLSPVLGLSCEPLLGPVFVDEIIVPYQDGEAVICPLGGQWVPESPCPVTGTIDWVIAGGESGPQSRPMHPDWPRSLRDQCLAAGVPFHFKQWGEWIPYEHDSPPMMFSQHGDLVDGHSIPDVTTFPGEMQPGGWMMTVECDLVRKVGKEKAGRLLDGREWDEFPRIQTSTTGER